MLPRARPHPFPATRRATLTVMALLAVHVILALVALQAVFLFVELAWRVLAGRDELRSLLATHLAQFRALRAVQAALWLVTGVAFLGWVARAQSNLATLGSSQVRYSPLQAVAAFVVPGPNLVRPLRVLRELWNASDPAPVPVMGRGAPARVGWWWGLLLGAVAADGVARGLALWSGVALDLGPAMQALIVGQLLAVAAAIVGIAVVHGVDVRQEEAAWSRGGC